MPSEPRDVDQGRVELLRLLQKRMIMLLHANIPDSYYVGKEYVEDQRKAKCLITALAFSSGEVPSFEFRQNGAFVRVRQKYALIQIEVERIIPQRLWDDMRLMDRGERFIIGYLREYMPLINRRLLEARYSRGHPLIRTIALFELVEVFVTCQGRRLHLRWPVTVASFPPTAQLAPQSTEIYVRDFIDACSSYFRNDYDECIRRVVTSTENFVRARGWQVNREPWYKVLLRFLLRRRPLNRNSFRRRLKDNLRSFALAGEVINENLQFVYSVRNGIVHDLRRLSPDSDMFCNKAIGTLKYLIYRHSGNSAVSQYVFYLHMQFMLQCGIFGDEYNIDVIRKRNDQKTPLKIVNAPSDMDELMFSSLRFSPKDKQSATR